VVTPVVVTQEVTQWILKADRGHRYPRYRSLSATPMAGQGVSVKPGMINNYRIGDYVLIHPTVCALVTLEEENPKDFEGEIIRVDMPQSQIVVQDTNGREEECS